jgi:hypothetical protein
MWRFLKWRHVVKVGDFRPRHMDSSDEVGDEDSLKLLTNITALV